MSAAVLSLTRRRRRSHAYTGCLRVSAGLFVFWRASCKCGWFTRAEHLSHNLAMGALMEHIVGGNEETKVG